MALKYNDLGTQLMREAGATEGSLLGNCNPLVSNFGLSLISSLGFKNVYLAGIDCGMKTCSEHHSKDSIYYKGLQKSSVEPTAKELIEVEGNKDGVVYTTDLLNQSRLCLQLVLSNSTLNCFNFSEGAKIDGSVAVYNSEELKFSPIKDKRKRLETLLEHAFAGKDMDSERTMKQVKVLKKDFAQCISSIECYFDIGDLDLDGIFVNFNKVEKIIKFYKINSLSLYTLLNGSLRGLMINLVAAKRNLPPNKFNEFYDSIKPEIDLFLSEMKRQMKHSTLAYDTVK